MRIMVTGGAGFIGSNIVEHFYKDNEVIVYDNLRTGFKKNIKDLKICIKKGELIDRITKRIITGRSFTSIIIR